MSLKFSIYVVAALALAGSSMAITPVTPWCTTAGGVGDYSTKCPSSVGKWTVSVLELL